MDALPFLYLGDSETPRGIIAMNMENTDFVVYRGKDVVWARSLGLGRNSLTDSQGVENLVKEIGFIFY